MCIEMATGVPLSLRPSGVEAPLHVLLQAPSLHSNFSSSKDSLQRMSSSKVWTKDTWEWWPDSNRKKMREEGEDPAPLDLQLDPQPHPGVEEGVNFLNHPLVPKRPESEFCFSHLQSD